MEHEVLQVFEELVLNQTRSFLQAIGADELKQRIRDVASIQKNAAMLVLISYTRTFGRRPQGIKLKMETERDHFDNLQRAIDAVIRKYHEFAHGPEIQTTRVSAEAILRGGGSRTALAIHSLVHILSQLFLVHVLSVNAPDSPSGEVAGAIPQTNQGFAGVTVDQVHLEAPPAEQPSHEPRPHPAPGRVREQIATVEQQATQYVQQLSKHKRAARRKKRDKEKKLSNIRDRNAQAAEQARHVKLQKQEHELELAAMANRLRQESQQESRVHGLMEDILRAMNQDIRDETEMNTQHLRRLEQERISQAASAARLFKDRAEMIEDYSSKLSAEQEHNLKEQKRFMAAVLKDATTRHELSLEAKTRQIHQMEEAYMQASKETQYSLARLFNVKVHEYDSRDRMIAVAPSPFEKTLRRIRGNALTLRQQQRKQWKQRRLAAAYRPTRPRTA